jgi:phage anti-repressor protein
MAKQMSMAENNEKGKIARARQELLKIYYGLVRRYLRYSYS